MAEVIKIAGVILRNLAHLETLNLLSIIKIGKIETSHLEEEEVEVRTSRRMLAGQKMTFSLNLVTTMEIISARVSNLFPVSTKDLKTTKEAKKK